MHCAWCGLRDSSLQTAKGDHLQRRPLLGLSSHLVHPLPTAHRQARHTCRKWRRLDSKRTKLCRAQDSKSSAPELGDEPEATVLVVACGIGLATGAGVVLFNDAILWIRHLAFLQAPVQSVAWGLWARQLSLQSSLLVIALPPTVGGLTVGLLRYMSAHLITASTLLTSPVPGGFADPLPASQLSTDSQRSAGKLQSLVGRLNRVQAQALRRFQNRQTSDKSSAAGEQAQLRSDTEINRQDSGSRDFQIKSRASAEPGVKRPASQQAEHIAEPVATSSDQLNRLGDNAELRWQVRAVLAPVLRAVAAAITLGSGCSLGPEGPSVEIGRSTARGLGRVLRSKQRRLLPLLAAGSGAGVSAGFGAPISGVFFAVESVLQREPRDSETEARNSSGLTVAMVLLASVVAAIVSQAGLGDTPAFRVPPYQLQSIWEIPLVMLLGSTCGLVSVAFSYCSELSSNVFRALNPEGAQDPLVWVMLPAVGGLCTGLVALAFPEILYQGYGNVNALLELRAEDYAPSLLLQMLAAKVLATAVCRGSGLVGGIYAPSIFMGAALGSAFGGIAQAAFSPTGLIVAAPKAYALVGVAGMLAANCQVPLTAVLLLFELTHDYFIIVPTLAAVGISYWTASLPIAAQISARLQASTGPEAGAGSVTSVDGDELLPGESLIRSIRISTFTANKDRIRAADSRVSIYGSAAMKGGATSQQSIDGSSVTTPEIAELQSPQAFEMSPEIRAGATSRAEAQQDALALSSANERLPVRAEGAATAAVMDAVQELTAQCAVEEACVLVTRDTPLAEALMRLDEASQTAALMLNDEQMVIGVLTRDRIMAALETECSVPASEDSNQDASCCTVELVVSAGRSNGSP